MAEQLEPAATSFVLCPGTGRKKAGIFPAIVIISGFLPGIRHAADFIPCLQENSRRI
ncbi:hypothetical protein O6A27_26075 [Escherichia coli]|nr:hypothetical protein [Escherichia coli]